MAKGKHKPAPGAVRKDKVIHPHSRKAQKISKKDQRMKKVHTTTKAGCIRLQALGDKLSWFKDNLSLVLDDPESELQVATHAHLRQLAEAFMSRFEEELEQIELKRSVGGNKAQKNRNNQHCARLDAIELAIKTEKEEWEGCGLEMPDLLDAENLKYFQDWNGELRYVQNIKVRRFRKTDLEKGENDMETE